jgi:putative ABC transport system permease protein
MLSLKDTLKIAIGGVTVHKSRTLLTILGIIIGITSVVTIMSVGEGAQEYIVGQIESFGAQNVFIIPGRQPKGPTEGAATLISDSLKQRDVDELSKSSNVPDAVRVVPVVFGTDAASYESQIMDSVMVLGSTDYIQSFFDLKLQSGMFFDQTDINDSNRVIIIGDEVRKELFGNNSYPLNERIKINDINFRVIGFLQHKGGATFVDFNKAIVAPYSVVQEQILGIKHFQRIVVEARSTEAVPNMTEDITATLRTTHNIDDPSKDDFWIETPAGIASSVKTITDILTVLLAAMAAISLIVGGVGIMNIMFVSVTERTKEIGLRKALGATNKNILFQFLIEALVLTLGGGMIGIILGTVFSAGASYAAKAFAQIDFPYVFSLQGAILGVGVSTAIGLAFGIIPAYKAAKKSPVESLRS